MKNILIIGATGSTGLYLTDYLKNGNYKVFATGNKSRPTNYFINNCIEYFQIDLKDKASFDQLPRNKIDVVILLAGSMPARMKGYDPYEYLDTNIKGTLNVLEYCKTQNIPKIIYALSHSDVAGYWNTGLAIKEDFPPKLNLKGDHAVYIISKLTAVNLIEHYHLDYGIKKVIFRLPTIYGYWPDSLMFVDGKPKEIGYLKLINKAIKGEDIEIWGNPKVSKDIVYVKDFIQLIENANGLFNVGSGIATTLEEQIMGIIDVFSPSYKKSKIIYRPEKPTQTSYIYDISRAKELLNYQIKFPYKVMLEDMKQEMQNPMFSQLFSL